MSARQNLASGTKTDVRRIVKNLGRCYLEADSVMQSTAAYAMLRRRQKV